jgi:hypothetical protein
MRELFRIVRAERHHIFQREELRVVYLLADFANRIFERDVVARTQSAHIRHEAVRRDPLLQVFQVLRSGVDADERLFFSAAEQARRFVACGFDLFQRLVERPFCPGTVKTADGPVDFGFGRKVERRGRYTGDGYLLNEITSVHIENPFALRTKTALKN